MNILAGITNFVGGGLFKEIKEAITSYFPPDMTPQQKAEMEIKVSQMLENKLEKANNLLSDASKQLDSRIAEQEGTAKDLQGIPLLGPIVLFLRGVQRPAWGFATMWMDFKWFFEAGVFSDKQETAMIVINMLVLGFLFGERTIKNLEPLIVKIFGGSK